MKFKPWQIKWMLSLFPPLLFSRVRVKAIADDFSWAEVGVRHSVFNKNLQKTIFGGTIFSAFDPFHSILFWQIFAHRGQKLEAWLKSAEIDYKKPATSDLSIRFEISAADIQAAEIALQETGKFQQWMTAKAIDKQGNVCAEARLLVYLRNFKGHSANF